ncbi:MAG: hypothetical protein RJQ14_26055, partial [Marinoscillum sp.]
MQNLNISRENLIQWSGEIMLGKVPAGLLSDGYGNLTMGIEVNYPPVYMLSPEEYNGFKKDLVGALRQMLPNSIVHVLDFYSVEQNEINYGDKKYATKYHYRQFDGTSHTQHRSFWFFTFLADENFKLDVNYSKSAGAKGSGKKAKISEKQYNTYYTKIKSEFVNRFKEIKGISQMSRIKVLDLKMAKSVLLNYFNQSYDSWEDYNGQHLEPMMVEDGRVMIGANYVGVNTLSQWPDLVSNWDKGKGIDPTSFNNGMEFRSDISLPVSMSYPIGLGLPINHIVSTTMLITEQDKAVKRLHKELDADRNISMWNREIYSIKKDLIKGSDTEESFAEELARTNSVPIIFNQNVILKGRTIEELYEYQEFTAQAYGKFKAQ